MSELELTKKAEAYVAAQVSPRNLEGEVLADLQDPGTSFLGKEVLTLHVDRTSRKALATSIEALIDMLDELSPDCDLEDTADDEPSLGWGGKGLPTVSWPQDGRGSMYDDRELDDSDTEANGDELDASAVGTICWSLGGHWNEDSEEENEHGGDINDEAHDGDFDNEPSLGWGNTTGQSRVGLEGWNDTDAEQFTAEGGLGFTGEGHEEARQMLRQHRQALRPERSLTIVGPVVTVPGWRGPLSQADVDSPDARAHYWAAKGF